MTRIVVPQLPLAYNELRTAGEEFAGHFVAEQLPVLLDAIGLPHPRLSKRKQAGIKRRMQQFLLESRGYLLGTQLLDEEISPPLARYAFLEGELRQGLMLGTKPEHGEYDAWIILLRRLAKQASRPTRKGASLPGYDEARDAVDALAAETVVALESGILGPELESWHQLNEALKVRHFAQRLPTLARSWRWREPSRLTQKLIGELSHEYRESAAMFELLIARLVGVKLLVNGTPRPWHALHGQPLANNLQLAASAELGPALAVLATGIRREVRNALAHGPAVYMPKDGKVAFHARNAPAIEWTTAEFYRNTRRLSAFVLAMIAFESQLQLVRYRGDLEQLANLAIAAGATPREVEVEPQRRGSRR